MYMNKDLSHFCTVSDSVGVLGQWQMSGNVTEPSRTSSQLDLLKYLLVGKLFEWIDGRIICCSVSGKYII